MWLHYAVKTQLENWSKRSWVAFLQIHIITTAAFMVENIRGKFIFLHRKSLLISNSLRLMQKPFRVGKDTGACIHMEPSLEGRCEDFTQGFVSGEESWGYRAGKQGTRTDEGGWRGEGGSPSLCTLAGLDYLLVACITCSWKFSTLGNI